MCWKPLQYRARWHRAKRQWARRILVDIARFAPDPFSTRWIRLRLHAAHRRNEIRGGSIHDALQGIEWLRQHGFFRHLGGHGLAARYELSEKAVRWLDWIGFQWKAAV